MAERHLYLTYRGSYIDSHSAGEFWQCGVRLAMVQGNIDPLGTLPTNLEVLFEEHTDQAADYTTTGNFTMRGPLIANTSFNPVTYLGDQARLAFAELLVAGVSNNVQLDTITISPVEAPGRVVQTEAGIAKATLAYLNRPRGSATNPMLPTEVSVALSWDTAASGKRGNGRIFLPPFSTAAISSGGRMTSAQTNAVALAGKRFCEKLTYSAPLNAYAIAPIVTSKPFIRYGRIQQTRVGDVFDAQRRRRNALTEAYSKASVAQ